MRSRVRRWMTKLLPSSKLSKPLLGPVAGTVAAVVVLFGAWWSASSLELDRANMNLFRINVSTLLTGGLMILNAFEYRLSTEIAGNRRPFGEAFRVALYASIANLLPIPGGVLVRVAGLRSSGARTGTALGATALIGVVWLTLGALVGAAVLLAAQEVIAAAALAAIAATAIVVACLVLPRPEIPVGSVVARAIMIEGAFLLLAMVRIVLTGTGIGIVLGFKEGSLLAVASVLAATVGLIPGGLGLWEGLSALLMSVVDVAPEVGFLTAAVVRMENIAGFAITLLVVRIVAAVRSAMIKRGEPRRSPDS